MPLRSTLLSVLIRKSGADEYEFTLRETRTYEIIEDVKNLRSEIGITMEDLQEYPYLSFEQGEYNSFYFSEEILSAAYHKKNIHVNDRAALFNLLIGLNGYTISTGILSADLNGTNIVAVPLQIDDSINVGWIANHQIHLSNRPVSISRN